jgi:hypothetical protein
MSAFAQVKATLPFTKSYATVVPRILGKKLCNFLTLFCRLVELPLTRSPGAQKFSNKPSIPAPKLVLNEVKVFLHPGTPQH